MGIVDNLFLPENEYNLFTVLMTQDNNEACRRKVLRCSLFLNTTKRFPELVKSVFKMTSKLCLVEPHFNLSMWEEEAGGLGAPGQHWLHIFRFQAILDSMRPPVSKHGQSQQD